MGQWNNGIQYQNQSVMDCRTLVRLFVRTVLSNRKAIKHKNILKKATAQAVVLFVCFLCGFGRNRRGEAAKNQKIFAFGVFFLVRRAMIWTKNLFMLY
jgi:hypothetical protein